jgi:hypothetical protein
MRREVRRNDARTLMQVRRVDVFEPEHVVAGGSEMMRVSPHPYHSLLGDAVIILAVWGARRRRGPRL